MQPHKGNTYFRNASNYIYFYLLLYRDKNRDEDSLMVVDIPRQAFV